MENSSREREDDFKIDVFSILKRKIRRENHITEESINLTIDDLLVKYNNLKEFRAEYVNFFKLHDDIKSNIKNGIKESIKQEEKPKVASSFLSNQLVVKISSKKVYEVLDKVILSFNINNWNVYLSTIFEMAFKHFKDFLKQKRTKGINQGNIEILDNIKNNSGDSKLELDLPPKPYIVIPESISFLTQNNNQEIDIFSEEILNNNEKFPFTEVYMVESFSNHELSKSEELVLKRFEKFLIFFGNQYLIQEGIIDNMKYGIPLIHLNYDEVIECAKFLREKENSTQEIINKIQNQFINFTNHFIDRPKGVLFFGPPRTGKTYTSTKIINQLNFYMIYPSLSAADFSHGIVGQSEKMIDAITKRCEVIPWELCIIYIDEIDSLAPNRNLASTSNSQSSIIGQFLAITDGNKKKNNLLMIGTTNRLEYMDPAFAQRMDIKIFLGVPNFQGREKWINNYIADFRNNNKKYEKILSELDNNKQLKNEIKFMTLNFSADAMKKCLSEICVYFTYLKEIPKNKEEYRHICFNIIENLCKRDGIYFGKYILPNIVRSIPVDFSDDPELVIFEELLKMMKIEKNKVSSEKFILYSQSPTGRILIDLSTKAIDDQFQLEVDDSLKITEAIMNLIHSVEIQDSILKFEKNLKTQLFQVLLHYQDDYSCKEFIKRAEDSFSELKNENANQKLNLNPKEFQEKFIEKLFINITKKKVVTFKKKSGFKIKEEVLRVLIKSGLELNLDYILLLDFDYFLKKNIIEELKIVEELSQCVEEAKKYDKSMIIFDLDSLCDTIKQFNQQNSDLQHSRIEYYKLTTDNSAMSFSEQIVRQTVLQICLNYLESTVESSTNHWTVGMSSNAKICSLFKDKLKWSQTNYETNLEKEMEEIYKERICIWCNSVYMEKDNIIGSCGRHRSERVYLEHEYNHYSNLFNEKFGKSEIFMRKEKTKMIEKNDIYKKYSVLKAQIEKGSINSSQVRWECCGKSFYEKGEIPEKHESI
jgi:hypothetical protein